MVKSKQSITQVDCPLLNENPIAGVDIALCGQRHFFQETAHQALHDGIQFVQVNFSAKDLCSDGTDVGKTIQKVRQVLGPGFTAAFLCVCAEAHEKKRNLFLFQFMAMKRDKINQIGQGVFRSNGTSQDDGVIGFN